MSAEEIGACCCAWRVGRVLLIMHLVQLPVWRLKLIAEGASTLVLVTPLMSAFFLQLLSAFFFCAQHAYRVIIVFAHMIYILLDMHVLALLG